LVSESPFFERERRFVAQMLRWVRRNFSLFSTFFVFCPELIVFGSVLSPAWKEANIY